jgi:hypothetical protein
MAQKSGRPKLGENDLPSSETKASQALRQPANHCGFSILRAEYEALRKSKTIKARR